MANVRADESLETSTASAIARKLGLIAWVKLANPKTSKIAPAVNANVFLIFQIPLEPAKGFGHPSKSADFAVDPGSARRPAPFDSLLVQIFIRSANADRINLEPAKGFEPPTVTLQKCCSTTELRWLVCFVRVRHHCTDREGFGHEYFSAEKFRDPGSGPSALRLSNPNRLQIYLSTPSGLLINIWCRVKDSNLRSRKASDLQSDVIDHSTNPA